jgi:3-oxoacyl-[acyl-carrier protein] reductase
MDTGLNGMGVVVTGGGGGIGQAVVRAFAAEGARVAVHYRTSAEAARSLAEEIGGVAIQADLRVEEQVDALVPRALELLGRVDVVVANAGVWPADDVPIADLSLGRWNETLTANLTATFLTARGFLRHAATTRQGSLVMVSSTAGVFGEAGHADYAAAKGAILSGLLLSAKNEAARLGGEVRVNVVAPGWTVTPMTSSARRNPDLEKRVTSTMALKKLGSPEDVAAQVVVLASPRLSGHVTGQIVVVAGGMEGRLVP